MPDTAYIEAVYQEPPVILGLQLRPFSAGHRLLLEKCVKFDGSKEQLALAVLICTQTHDEALADLQSPELPRVMERFARRLSWVGRWPFRQRRQIDFAAEWARFLAWFRLSNQLPDYDRVEAGHASKAVANVSGTHFVHAVWSHARENMKWPEFLDHPWRLLVWDMMIKREQEGELRLLSPEYMASIAKAEALANATKTAYKPQEKEAAHVQ